MKNKLIIIIGVILVAVTGIIIFVVTREDDNSLTIIEKKWIDDNKNKVIDFSISGDIPIFTAEGKGIVFDFLQDLEENTGLEFNEVSTSADYGFLLTDSKNDKDIFVDRDNYVLLTKEKKKYTGLDEIKNITIGVLSDDLSNINKYLPNLTNVTFKPFKDEESMFKELTASTVNAIAVNKTNNLKNIITNKDLNIAYNITEYTKDYVIKLGSEEKLNNIITKYYQKWKEENYDELYNKALASIYFDYSNITDQDKSNFKSKTYKYGFIENGIYNGSVNKVVVGLNDTFIQSFADMTGIDVSYKKYNSYETLLRDFNANELDFIFNDTSIDNYAMDVFNTTSVYDEGIVVASPLDMNITVNSILSLSDLTVSAVKNSDIANYLAKNNIKVKQYDNVGDLVNDLNNSVIVIDKLSFDYYKKELVDYKIDFTTKLDSDYVFTFRDIKENEAFENLFDFYLSYVDETKVINDGYSNAIIAKNNSSNVIKTVVYIVTGLLLVLIAATFYRIIFKKKKTPKISKDTKLKYIDMLTSLKNRNYLNDHIESWDSSKIYPQTIVIVDLNNIAYINDNYGHTEGDEVIREAANILIRNQLNNSEIIRTNGNEFLIYLVEYSEKDVTSYIKKLNKEFKELDHGFGAAIGYSVINDGIKTVDDAINEATLDMKNNKEELNN